MTMTPFNDGWTFGRLGETSTNGVTLPHDAMIGEQRAAREATGSHGAYFPGGRYRYAKSWTAPADLADRQLALFFEGVYGSTRVLVDGVEVATSISGYREFAVPLEVTPGSAVLIEVEVDNSATPNSRWYTGSGIYRKVWLEEVAATHITRDGIAATTELAGPTAAVRVDLTVENPDDRSLTARVELESPDGRRVTGTAAVFGNRCSVLLTLPDALTWSADTPHLHRLAVDLTEGTLVLDTRRETVGLRTIEVDAKRGLRINGESVLLRGACVHHDNGVLGSATHRAAEYRRARILKAAGFNAIRSSHNPLSRDFLDACDELGLYVLDELTDVWFGPKSTHDVAPHFDELWRDDARSMVAKDRLHPSVIMYSIGNEIAESGGERGIAAAHEISGLVRELDPQRPTTIAINFLLNVMAASGRSLFDTSEHEPDKEQRKPSAVTSTMANVLANRVGTMMQAISKLPKADKVSRATFTAVDVAGYNYAWGRYRGDAKRHPDRVVLGTESMPGDLPKVWPLVESLPNVIGDFLWTGWDYLGETGIGTWAYGNETASLARPFPELIAGCGLVDITGRPDAGLLVVQATWGLLDSPQIAVRPLDHAGEKVRRMAWRSTDAVQSWSWVGGEGRAAEIEVYSTDDQVELLLNGRSLGRKRAGARAGFVARFRVGYEPGDLVAIGYRGGRETSRSSLRSASAPGLRVVAETDRMLADGQDLVYLSIEIADADGIREMLDDDTVTVEVTGPAVLAGLGNARRATEESFVDATHSTWRGSALAILRSTGGEGTVEVVVTSDRHGRAIATVRAVRAHETAQIS
jgi:beta-galactosidase